VASATPRPTLPSTPAGHQLPVQPPPFPLALAQPPTISGSNSFTLKGAADCLNKLVTGPNDRPRYPGCAFAPQPRPTLSGASATATTQSGGGATITTDAVAPNVTLTPSTTTYSQWTPSTGGTGYVDVTTNAPSQGVTVTAKFKGSLQNVGGSQPHYNRQPYLGESTTAGRLRPSVLGGGGGLRAESAGRRRQRGRRQLPGRRARARGARPPRCMLCPRRAAALAPAAPPATCRASLACPPLPPARAAPQPRPHASPPHRHPPFPLPSPTHLPTATHPPLYRHPPSPLPPPTLPPSAMNYVIALQGIFPSQN
jgi:hypothetical protein